MSFFGRWTGSGGGGRHRAAQEAAQAAPVADAFDDPPEGARYGGRMKGCSHLCSLSSAMPCCCVCADKRPLAASYEEYVDGKGVIKTAGREAHYCLECKAAFQRAERAPAAPRRPAAPAAAAETGGVTVEEYRGLSVKPCGHACSLTATPACCACVDARPIARDGKYEHYVDGRGVVPHAARHDYYCARCKAGVVRGDRGVARSAAAAAAASSVEGGRAAAAAAPAASRDRMKTCSHACVRAGPVCCQCEDTRVPAADGLYWTPVPGRGVVRMPKGEVYCTSCRARPMPTAPAVRAPIDAGASMSARAAAAAASMPAPPVLARNVSVSSPEPCPICAHNKLFTVRGFSCSAVCKYCNSVFPPDVFSPDFVSALPVMSDEDAVRVVARMEQLAAENSTLRLERHRSGEGLRALDVSLELRAPPPSAPPAAAAVAVMPPLAPQVPVVAATSAAAPARAIPMAMDAAAAQKVRSEELSARNILAQLCCTVCLDVYTDPITLPTCGHSFCRVCIMSVAGSSARTGAAARGRDCVACPICRTVAADVSSVAISTELAFVLQALSNMVNKSPIPAAAADASSPARAANPMGPE